MEMRKDIECDGRRVQVCVYGTKAAEAMAELFRRNNGSVIFDHQKLNVCAARVEKAYPATRIDVYDL